MRQAKAWAVKPTWSDEHDYAWAPTAGKARYRFLLEIGDSYPDLKVHEIVARRAVHQDRWLPDEHRLVAELSAEDKAVILGAYGASNYRRPDTGITSAPAPAIAGCIVWRGSLVCFAAPTASVRMAKRRTGPAPSTT